MSVHGKVSVRGSLAQTCMALKHHVKLSLAYAAYRVEKCGGSRICCVMSETDSLLRLSITWRGQAGGPALGWKSLLVIDYLEGF